MPDFARRIMREAPPRVLCAWMRDCGLLKDAWLRLIRAADMRGEPLKIAVLGQPGGEVQIPIDSHLASGAMRFLLRGRP